MLSALQCHSPPWFESSFSPVLHPMGVFPLPPARSADFLRRSLSALQTFCSFRLGRPPYPSFFVPKPTAPVRFKIFLYSFLLTLPLLFSACTSHLSFPFFFSTRLIFQISRRDVRPHRPWSVPSTSLVVDFLSPYPRKSFWIYYPAAIILHTLHGDLFSRFIRRTEWMPFFCILLYFCSCLSTNIPLCFFLSPATFTEARHLFIDPNMELSPFFSHRLTPRLPCSPTLPLSPFNGAHPLPAFLSF